MNPKHEFSKKKYDVANCDEVSLMFDYTLSFKFINHCNVK